MIAKVRFEDLFLVFLLARRAVNSRSVFNVARTAFLLSYIVESV